MLGYTHRLNIDRSHKMMLAEGHTEDFIFKISAITLSCQFNQQLSIELFVKYDTDLTGPR